MMMFKVPSGKEVLLPSTGDDWQLYTSMECESAALALTQALKTVVIEIDTLAAQGLAPTSKKLSEMYMRIVHPVMSKYADLGASDSEPRHAVLDTMEHAVKTLLGVSVRVWG